ncbi:MAG: antitoxin [Kineosporiaceae bacterium]
MRTTVTLDADVAAAVQAVMRERGMSFKAALNTLVRRSVFGGSASAQPFTVTAFAADLAPGVDLATANRLAAELEDEETLRELELGR